MGKKNFLRIFSTLKHFYFVFWYCLTELNSTLDLPFFRITFKFHYFLCLDSKLACYLQYIRHRSKNNFFIQLVALPFARGYKEMSSFLAEHLRPCIWAQMRREGGIAGSQPISTAVHSSPNTHWRSNSIFNPFISITPSKPLMSSGSWLTLHNCKIFFLLAVNYDPATTDLIFIRVNIYPGPGEGGSLVIF